MKAILKYILILIVFPVHIQAQFIYEKELSGALNMGLRKMHQFNNGDMLFATAMVPSSPDSSMAVLIKTDSLLEIKWAKRYKIFHKDHLTAITPLSDGNLIIGGSGREDFNMQSGAVIYKIDTAGNVLWYKLFSQSYDDAVLSVFERSDNSLMVFIRKGVYNYPTKVVHLTSAGTEISKREYMKGSLALFAEQVVADNQGNYYMSGVINNDAQSRVVLFLAQVDDSGLNWYKEYEFPLDVTNQGLIITSDGYLAVCGNIPDLSFPNTNDMLLLKIDLQGNPVWVKEVGQSLAFNDNAWTIQEINPGRYVVAGQCNTVWGFQAAALALNPPDGIVLWANSYGSYPFQSFYSIYPFTGNRILLMGAYANANLLYLTSGTGDSPCSSTPMTTVAWDLTPQISSPAVSVSAPNIVYNSPGYAISEVTSVVSTTACSGYVGLNEFSDEGSPDIFPNPASESIFIVNPPRGNYELQLYDFTGRIVLREQNKTELVIQMLDEGNYLLRITSNTVVINRNVQIIK